MADYTLTATNAVVIRNSDMASIPNDMANRDWVEYQEWLAVPNTPDPYVEPPKPPPTPKPTDANLRIDAGVLASLDVALEVRDAIHNIPTTFNAANFARLLAQFKVSSDAFVAMLEAHAETRAAGDIGKPDRPTKPPTR